jgi:hypothetical protein
VGRPPLRCLGGPSLRLKSAEARGCGSGRKGVCAAPELGDQMVDGGPPGGARR